MPYDVTDFQQEVVEASHERPVLVDFWAPWCGPCRALGPVLERLAAEQSAWRLAKVNTDEHPDDARRYGVRGIPAVKLFSEGTVVDEFTGALPEPAVRRWLERVLPSKAKKLLGQSETLLAEGRPAEAALLLREALIYEPGHVEVQIRLAQALAFDAPEEAAALAQDADAARPDLLQIKEAVLTIARLLRLAAHPDELPASDARADYAAALSALADSDFDAALDGFIRVVQKSRAYDDDGARKACVALFTLLSSEHEAVRRHRRTFDMALY